MGGAFLLLFAPKSRQHIALIKKTPKPDEYRI
jgi:hypothetical protein